ncbi:MBG domain-containing protein [Algoriphagus yeomjeoni]|uniref:MBG domain-containing protein n=1 Tax=Algoriphagus yeomjeoni TaxID=291403 RepID=UPI003CE469D4
MKNFYNSSIIGILSLSFLLFFGNAFSAIAQSGTATVTTDKDDYAPGEYVIITGSGWEPGERVDFHFEETPKPETCVNSHDYFAIADENGDISYSGFLIKDNHLGVAFVLTATGQISGRVAVTEFTDANITVAASGLPAGTSLSVSYRLGTSENVPTGSYTNTASFTPPATPSTFVQSNKEYIDFIFPDVVVSGVTYSSTTINADGDVVAGPNLRYRMPNNSAKLFTGIYVSVCSQPSISDAPTAKAITYGDSEPTFSVTATGDGLSYQWQYNTALAPGTWNNVGINSSSYTVPSPGVSFSGRTYRVVITGSCGTVTSSAVGLTVNKKPLTATSTVASKVYNGSPITGTVSLGTVSGLIGTETLLITPSASNYADANAGVGKATTISYSLADGTNGGLAANYSMADLATTGTISKRAATWTTDVNSKIYGEADPSPLTTGSGDFLAGDNITATYTRATGETVAGGPYQITATLVDPNSKLANYTITNPGADFSITQRAITITVDAGQTKIYGDADPLPFTATVTSGVIQGADVATGTLARVAGEDVGSYAISQNDYTYGSNYDETFVGDDFSITQRAITITVDAGQTKIYGDADPLPFTATVTSGVIQGADVATGTLARVAGEDVGSYAISQNDYTYGSNYDETFVGDDFSITQRAITITVDAGQTKIYGDADPLPFTATVTSGVIQGADVATGTLARVAGEDVGSYAISQNDYTYGSNYDETFVGDDFSITQRAITITVDAGQTKIYGDADPLPFTATVTSGVIQGADVATGTLARVAGEDVGSYAISQNDYTYGSNYDETFVGDDFSITQRAITITVDAGQTKIYGDADPLPFTATVTSGVIQGADVATGTLARVAGEDVGSYAISQNDYTYGSNYDETFVGDDFSITQRAITITVDAGQTKIYGDADPLPFTATVTSGVIQGADVATGTLARVAGEDVGSYAISQNDYTYGSNYDETFVGDDFSITQRAITITVDAGQTKIYGDADPLPFTATVTSGVIQGADVATGTLARVAGEDVGSYAISQNDYTYGSNYDETFVGDDFSITQRAITITVDAGQTKIYGDADPLPFTATVTSGVIQGADVATGTLARVAGEDVGSYAISQNDYTYGSNYDETFVGDDFSITQRAITITVDAGQTKIYGDADPLPFTATVTSGVIQGADVATGTLARVAGEDVGSYAISQNDYTYGSNYDETFVGDDFSITQRAITITVDAGQTKIYGDADPLPFTATVTSGVIQGADVATGTLARVAGEDVGSYAISQNDYTYGSNYDETFVGDDFSITQRAITITVDAGQTKIYGDADPLPFTATVTSGVIQGADVATGTLARVAGEDVGSYAISQNDYTYGSNYDETFVGDDFSITQRAITITVDAGQTKIYGDADPLPFTATVTSGVIQGADVATGTLARVAGEDVGSYAISQNDYTYGSNYDETFVGDDFSITQRAITITVDAGQTKIYGDADPLPFTATVTSGVIQGADVATGTLARVAGEDVGSYAISQNDYTYGSNYDETFVGDDFSITQRAITITVDAGQTKIYGDADPLPFTATVTSGVIQGADVATGTLARVAGEDVGSYAISQNDYTYGSNYDETFVGDDFSITQRAITITVDAGQTKIYGDADPLPFTATVTSGVIQGADVATGTLARVAGEDVGSYAISQNDYTYGSNYDETFVGDDFSITQRAITITVDAGQTKIYGDADPLPFTATVTSGVIQGADVATGTLARVAGEDVGSYAISQNDYTYGSNYDETFVGDDFSITQRAITITVDAGQTKIYGDADPLPFTATVTSGVIQGADVATGTLARVAGEDVGSYAISQNDYTYGSNYDETFVGDDFSITQRAITITVDAGQTKIYGDADPLPFTATVTSGVIQGADVATGTLARVAGEDVGSYAISQNDYTYGSNYDETFVGDDFSITQRAITITVDAGQTKIYGDADPLPFTATVTSGVIQGADVATGTLARVAGEDVGSYAISQNDYTYGSNYDETFVGDDFSITQRAITITVDAGQTKIYGDADPLPFTATVTSGVIQGADVATGTLARVAGEDVGSYAISQNDYTYGSNYDETFVGDDFSITQRAITITVDAGQTKIYGDADPLPFTATVTSGVIQGADVATGTLARVAGEDVGSYAISQNDYTYGSNYDETFVGDDFSITQRAITITVDAGQTKIYGDADPLPFTATVTSGVIQGADVATGTLARVAGEDVGSYAISQNDYTYGSNYDETFVGDDFSITQRAITITVDAGQTKIYGDADPLPFTATVTSGVIQGADVATGTLARVAGEDVGSYAISQNDYTYGSNYDETFVGDDFSITQRAITITVDAGQTKIYGDADPLPFTATVTSGVIQGADVATGTLARVAGEDVGSYAISQNDYTYGSNYDETFVGDDFSITQRAITITVDAGQTKIYGDADPLPFTATVTSGVIQGADVATGTLARVAGEDVGSYAISQNDYTYGSNYDETFVGDDFSITQRAITITVDAGQTKIYGDADPLPFTATVTSGVIQGADVATGTLARVAGEDVGSYAISQNDYTYGSNYDETFVGDDFSITQRAITITVDAGQTKIYGDADPLPFTATVTSGVIQGADVATGTLARVAGEDVGSYAISQNDYTYGSNYDETFVGDDFSITQRAITITVDAGQTKIYGDADPLPFTATVTSGVIQGADVATGTLARVAGEDVGSYAISQNDYTYGSNYDETFVGDDFSITQRAITITVDAGQTKIYGDADPLPFTATVTSGVIQGADVATGTLARVAGEDVGSYAISQNDYTYGSNYDETFVGDDFSITQRAITITVDAGQTKIYGDADPLPFTATVTSGVIQGADVATGTLARVAGEDVGSYAISQNDYTYGSNYDETFVGDDFSITQRAITITADNLFKYCGQVDPPLTYQITSGALVTGDGFTGELVRATGEGASNYSINQGTLALSSNYNFTYVPGTLTVNAVTLDITNAQNPRSINELVTITIGVTDGSTNLSDVLVTLNVGAVSYTATSENGIATFDLGKLAADLYAVTAQAGGCSESEEVFLPVYDPAGGFVTGGGWIDSPLGASKLYPTATGKANFGFNAKYKTGKNNTNEVDGNTNFQFKAGDLHFSSSAHHSMSLVISGAKATYTGEGTINGTGSYEFRLIAIDGNLLGNTVDKFRIKVWTKGNPSDVIYDNQKDVSESSDLATMLGGGSIVIHKPNGKGNKRIVTDLISVPWNTPTEVIEKKIASMSANWFDGKGIKLTINTESYNPLAAGFYELKVNVQENEWFALDEPITVNVLVADKPLATDIILSNSILLRNINAGTVIGDLSTIDPADDQHTYTIAEQSDFELVGKSIVWKGDAIPSNSILRVFSTDRAGQTIERSIELTREPRFGDFTMFPNPAESAVTIEVELEQSMNVGIRIYDAVGRLVFEDESVQNGISKHQITIDHLSPGLYTVQLKTGKLVMNKRLIKK